MTISGREAFQALRVERLRLLHDVGRQGRARRGLVPRLGLEPIADELLVVGRLGAAKAGVILADTKFEFGSAPDGSLVLIDEVLTPDSSRYWPAATWQPGRAQPSYDKQFVRDWLETQPWNKTAPGPTLPADVVQKTQALYAECLERLTA